MALQSNSEHSRHWFFKADIHIDGKLMPEDLFSLVKVCTTRHSDVRPNDLIFVRTPLSVFLIFSVPSLHWAAGLDNQHT